ncbi:homeobox-leucine zipper protein HDG11 [Trifolium repens]|nr:homeobox-leucine zipper protein HDG11 [Trifolium repens]
MFEHALNSIQGFSKNNELENSPMVHERSSHVHGLSNLTMREAMLISDNVSGESSKYLGIVGIDGMKLVEMFLDSEKWRNGFPTIVTKAETTKMLQTGLQGNRDGTLLLMNEEMHILSPLVRPREFNIIHYCKQVDVGVWVITDVSFDSSQPNTPPLSCYWKHPFGCMIHEMPNKSCMGSETAASFIHLPHKPTTTAVVHLATNPPSLPTGPTLPSLQTSHDVALISQRCDQSPWLHDATILSPLTGLLSENVGGSDPCCSGSNVTNKKFVARVAKLPSGELVCGRTTTMQNQLTCSGGASTKS